MLHRRCRRIRLQLSGPVNFSVRRVSVSGGMQAAQALAHPPPALSWPSAFAPLHCPPNSSFVPDYSSSSWTRNDPLPGRSPAAACSSGSHGTKQRPSHLSACGAGSHHAMRALVQSTKCSVPSKHSHTHTLHAPRTTPLKPLGTQRPTPTPKCGLHSQDMTSLLLTSKPGPRAARRRQSHSRMKLAFRTSCCHKLSSHVLDPAFSRGPWAQGPPPAVTPPTALSFTMCPRPRCRDGQEVADGWPGAALTRINLRSLQQVLGLQLSRMPVA